MKKKDIALISFFILISSAALFFSNSRNDHGAAYIYVSGDLLGVYDLNKPEVIHIEGAGGINGDAVIEDGSIYVRDMTCPYRECVKCGRISSERETICCLPAQVLIVVKSEERSGYDAITK